MLAVMTRVTHYKYTGKEQRKCWGCPQEDMLIYMPLNSSNLLGVWLRQQTRGLGCSSVLECMLWAQFQEKEEEGEQVPINIWFLSFLSSRLPPFFSLSLPPLPFFFQIDSHCVAQACTEVLGSSKSSSLSLPRRWDCSFKPLPPTYLSFS